MLSSRVVNNLHGDWLSLLVSNSHVVNRHVGIFAYSYLSNLSGLDSFDLQYLFDLCFNGRNFLDNGDGADRHENYRFGNKKFINVDNLVGNFSGGLFISSVFLDNDLFA